MQKINPSGAEWHIASHGHEAVVVQVGGGLRAYRADGEDYLDGYGPDEMAPGGAGQVLAPWPNRVRDGLFSFNGAVHQLPLSEPQTHSASHGLVRWTPWQHVSSDGSSVVLECFLPAQPGYPWPLMLSTTWSVSAEGLRAEHEATNVGEVACPFGLGTHPYVRVPGVRVDDLSVRVPARSRLLLDGRKLPIGAAKVAGGEWDFTSPRRIGAALLDTSYGDVVRDGSGRSMVDLFAADGRGVCVWADSAFSWWQVYTGDTLPKDRARRALAVEPMTCPPDAFHSSRDLVVLKPGETWRGAWGIRAGEDTTER